MEWKAIMEPRVELGWRVDTGKGGGGTAENGDGVTGKM